MLTERIRVFVRFCLDLVESSEESESEGESEYPSSDEDESEDEEPSAKTKTDDDSEDVETPGNITSSLIYASLLAQSLLL